MFVVTNRRLIEKKNGTCELDGQINENGPNELRVVEAEKKGGKWVLTPVVNELKPESLKEIKTIQASLKNGEQFNLKPKYGSDYVAIKLLANLRKKKRNLLLFVHGFNNDIEDVLDRSESLSRHFNLEVLPFSWPANGGGVKGAVSYKSDKRDARASIGALDRVIEKMHGFLNDFNEARIKKIYDEAETKHPKNMELRDAFTSAEIEKGCPFTVNAMFHSMGNYLFKNLIVSSVYNGRLLLFDNVVLVAADTNNKGHHLWVDEIEVRKRIYIAINEDDFALAASRAKSGQEQQARLGHYLKNLYSKRAVYVDVTGAKNVGNSHGYFEGDALKNKKIRRFFEEALNGRVAEGDLEYQAVSNTYSIRKSKNPVIRKTG